MKPSQKLTLGRILVSKNKAIGDTRYTDRLGSTFTTVFFVIKRRITAICSAKGRERETDFVFSAWTLSSARDGWVLHLSGMLWWCDKVLWHWVRGYPSEKMLFAKFDLGFCFTDFGPGLQSLHWSAALSCTKFKLNPEFLSWTAKKLLS